MLKKKGNFMLLVKQKAADSHQLATSLVEDRPLREARRARFNFKEEIGSNKGKVFTKELQLAILWRSLYALFKQVDEQSGVAKGVATQLNLAELSNIPQQQRTERQLKFKRLGSQDDENEFMISKVKTGIDIIEKRLEQKYEFSFWDKQGFYQSILKDCFIRRKEVDFWDKIDRLSCRYPLIEDEGGQSDWRDNFVQKRIENNLLDWMMHEQHLYSPENARRISRIKNELCIHGAVAEHTVTPFSGTPQSTLNPALKDKEKDQNEDFQEFVRGWMTELKLEIETLCGTQGEVLLQEGQMKLQSAQKKQQKK